ncbi:MAG: hypothetical protein JO297_02200, partial [Nitrososphaeraceae archaeon]|nr:hypothetical protein [Nitrososphaeraceae archaeon]
CTILGFPLGSDRLAYSQPSSVNANVGVDLINTHPSPLHLKSGSKFEIFSTVVNNSPKPIKFIAGRCDSPLSAQFSRNVLVRHMQGCTTTSPLFKLNSGARVSVAGPGSGTMYQAMIAGQIAATATLHYQTENGQHDNVTKPFTFTIS